MKKLKDFKGQKIAIHFPTYELWLRRKEINPSDELEDENWIYKEETCYFVDFDKGGEYDYIGWAKINNYTILPATDFLEEEFIYGQEYEFSDSKNFKNSEILIFGCKNPIKNNHYKYFAFDKDGDVTYYKYARKINTERTEAITTAKELIAKFDIKQDEIY